ncbi:MAG: branched-chain amino acid ABC transporter permease [Ottowia sp.]|uniref:branched-chain amino acid ABC transporter permease n=1 Tax=Ottowia sp. TaxID=1898956 RepID=UPI003C78AFDC
MVLSQILINGLVLGGMYLLVAVGFTLVFSIMRIVNFAHGEFFMLGGFAVYFGSVTMGLPYGIALLLAALAVGLIGVGIELLVFRPFRSDELNAMIASLGLAIIVQNVALVAFGPNPRSMDLPMEGAVEIGDLTVPAPRLFVMASAVAVFLIFHGLMAHTRLGRALRALAQDPETARIQGIRTERMIPLAFGIGAALAATAGALMGPVFSISPFTGSAPMLKAFIVVILGGLGSIPGAALGGLLLGIFESLTGTLLGAAISDVLQMLLVIAVLMFRPWGLLGQKEIVR